MLIYYHISGEPSAPENETKPLPTERVAVSRHGLGVGLKNKGASYDLGNTFGDSANMLGNDGFSTIYFRTESGNIYCLEDNGKGELINLNESRRLGDIVSHEFNRKYLEKQKNNRWLTPKSF